MKIIHVVGARPQFVKLAPLYNTLKNGGFQQIVIHTGQHYDRKMSEVFFDELSIPKPDFNLNINQGSHAYQTAEMMKGIENILLKNKDSKLIIYGDTNSTLAAAISASKIGIPIYHVEAGLRSFNRAMPEEINRILADRISSCLLVPTKTGMKNLENEGLSDIAFLTGDIMTDSIEQNIKIAKNKSDVLKCLNLKKNDYYLLTLHRPYNVDNPAKLFSILMNLSKLDRKILFPIHPRTRKILDSQIKMDFKNILLVEPQGYLDFLILEQNACKIITDSGGIQKEACILKRPCITLRSETEWVETVENKVNLLITKIDGSLASLIENFNPHFEGKNIFGTNVSQKMMEIIKQNGK